MQIGRKDIFWNYAATFLKIASSALLIPFILKSMPSEEVGIWTVFMTITSFTSLLDFGFSPSFTRNVTYVFSGVRALKTTGFEAVSAENKAVDYGLLKGVITAMRWFYLRMAVFLLLILGTLGTFYIRHLLRNYSGNHNEVYIAWALLCVINTYNLYTLYYDSLLEGKGLVKRSKQIMIIGNLVYLAIAVCMIVTDFGLVAIISAQIVSVVIIRWLSYHAFFTKEIKELLHLVQARSPREILKVIYPNAVKIGLTSLGGFMVQRSAIIIGSLYLSLEEIGSYGITMQLVTVISGMAGIYTATYQPKIAKLRVENNNTVVKELYLQGQIIQVLTFVFGGLALVVLGDWILKFIGSQTHLMPTLVLSVAILISFLENNHAVAGRILLTNNEVPFFKASLTAGALTILLLFLLFALTKMRLWAMVLAPGIAHLYNNFKWPYEVYMQLSISRKDIRKTLYDISKIYYK